LSGRKLLFGVELMELRLFLVFGMRIFFWI
jgi:hypothetical protein